MPADGSDRTLTRCATFGFNHAEPRHWTVSENALAEETAERTWQGVERAPAEAAQAKSETKYRILFTSIDEGFCIIEVLFDEQAKAVDYAFLESNPVFEKRAGFKITRGTRMR